MSTNQCECIFDPFPYGVIVSDRQGKILQINIAALKLFEVPSASLCWGRPYHQFLHHYEMDDEQHQAISLEPWLKNLIEERSESSAQETITLLQLPSGQKSYVTICSSPMYDAQKHVAETVHVFRDITDRYQKALRLLRVHRTVLKLTEAVGRISEQMDLTFPPETFILSPPVLAIEQQLVEVVAQVLDCRHIAIWAVGPPAGQLYFAARSGFTAEEGQRRQELSGRYFAREFLDQQALDRLRDSEAVILPAELKPMPPELRTEDRVKQWLMVPLFLEEQLEGGLVIGKADCDGDYTPEEIELVKAVATNTMLVLDCFRCLCGQA
ncbi:MAG TPA: PAS domain-containing protein [Ktedonobacteraceae bacterium]